MDARAFSLSIKRSEVHHSYILYKKHTFARANESKTIHNDSNTIE